MKSYTRETDEPDQTDLLYKYPLILKIIWSNTTNQQRVNCVKFLLILPPSDFLLGGLYSVGVVVGLLWNKARYRSSFASNTMPIVSVANWRVSLIWINVNRWIVDFAWRIVSRNFNLCSILKLQSGHTIWRRIRKRICVIGWIVYVRCVTCMTQSNHKVRKKSSPGVTIN